MQYLSTAASVSPPPAIENASDAAMARDIYRDVKAEDAPAKVERMLKIYMARRSDRESFQAFTRRHEIDALTAMFSEVA